MSTPDNHHFRFFTGADFGTTTTSSATSDWADAASYMLAKQIDKGILNGNWTAYDEYPIYTDGTKLLRDFAQLSCVYLDKKAISQRGWKSRAELRDV